MKALEARDDLFPTLTELWRDGKYIEVANIVAHTAPFSNRANLIDFCFISKVSWKEELKFYKTNLGLDTLQRLALLL